MFVMVPTLLMMTREEKELTLIRFQLLRKSIIMFISKSYNTILNTCSSENNRVRALFHGSDSPSISRTSLPSIRWGHSDWYIHYKRLAWMMGCYRSEIVVLLFIAFSVAINLCIILVPF